MIDSMRLSGYRYVGTLLWMFCLFFFKQKTAYELRISDWSSDVCSSDLLCGSASTNQRPRNSRPTSRAKPRMKYCMTRRRSSQLLHLVSELRHQSAGAAAVVGQRRAPAGGEHGDRRQQLAELAQIGRASGRESVCQ